MRLEIWSPKMKEDDLKLALNTIASGIANLAEKQSLIMQLLLTLPGLSDTDRKKLAESTHSGIASADQIRRVLRNL